MKFDHMMEFDERDDFNGFAEFGSYKTPTRADTDASDNHDDSHQQQQHRGLSCTGVPATEEWIVALSTTFNFPESKLKVHCPSF